MTPEPGDNPTQLEDRPPVAGGDRRGTPLHESLLAVVACVLLIATLIGAMRAFELRQLAAARVGFAASQGSQTRAVAVRVSDMFRELYQNLRTIARLPGVRDIDRYAEQFDINARTTVQEIYNTLSQSVPVSEFYIVPADLDPDVIDPRTGKNQEPITTFDHLIVGKVGGAEHSHGQAPRDDGASAHAPHEEDESAVEEVEIYEYRLMRDQLASFRAKFARESDITLLDYPAICGPQVVTCDNSRFDPAHPDDLDRSGIVYSVPFYRKDGTLGGCISAVVLTQRLREFIADPDVAIVNTAFGYAAPGIGQDGRTAGTTLDYAQQMRAAMPRKDLIYSECLPAGIRDIGAEWVIWSSSANADFEASQDAARLARDATIGYTASVVGPCILLLFFRLMRRNQLLVQRQNQELAHRVDERTRALQLANQAASAALRESEALRATVDQHAVVSVSNASGRIIDVNEGLCRLTGYSRDELVGADHRILSSGRHPRGFWATMWSTVSSGAAWRAEVCNRSKAGAEYWVDTIIAPFTGDDGRIERFVSIGHDVTLRREAEQRIAESERRFRALLESTEVIVWEYDIGSRSFTYVSPQALKLGFSVEAWMAPDFWVERLHPDDREEAIRLCLEQTAKFKSHRFQYRMVKADGEAVWIEEFASVESVEGSPTRLRGVLVDISERKRIEAQLLEAQATASAASRTKSEFLANMSHEIRTPLTAILGYSELLRDGTGDDLTGERRTQTIDTICAAGSHLMTIINDILDLSKIEAEKMTLEMIDTSPVAILGEVASLFRTRATGKGVALETSLSTPVPDPILCDPTRLRQILMNLVGNAVKFTEIGRVSIIAGVEGDGESSRFIVDVVDTGPGMTTEQAEKLFGVFGQADSTTTRRFGGTGLGLAISRRLANLMGGDVALLRTEAGLGSCFRLVLPLRAGAQSVLVTNLNAVREATATVVTAGPVTLSGRILLAEDGVDNQRLISFHLRRAGATVDIADNGRIALDLFEKRALTGVPYDLILTDIQMPELDGYSLARAIRQQGSTIGIVALTAHAMADDRQKCVQAGCDDYATKPIDRAQLIATCAAWMNRGKQAEAHVG